MVVLAASICTKGGKPVLSRQFRDMSRARIESLLASFPKLIPTNTQHTSVETAEVRYVYQPLEDLYILLITNKSSNILQDIETLHLFARVVSDMCRSAEERDITKHAFELLGAFDEIVSMGYRENVGLMQVRSVLEMESHEEKIQEIIARNKEAEAKEELKRRAKQLEMQRREQQRRAAAGGGSGMGGTSYLGGGISGYAPVSQRFEAPEPVARTNSSPAPSPLRPASFKSGSGMKLGSKKTKQAELLDALGGELASQPLLDDDASASAPITPALSASGSGSAMQASQLGTRGSMPEVVAESINIIIKEQLSISLLRDGGIKSMEVKGDMNLNITEPSLGRIRLFLTPPDTSNSLGNGLQFKQHPNVAKFTGGAKDTKTVSLKDPSKSFPIGQSLAVLKWRYVGTDESNVPLSINCWPTPSNDGTCEVSIEYELENDSVTLYDVVISIPLPAGSYPTVSSHSGSWSLNPSIHALDWTIPLVSSTETNESGEETRSGSLMFEVGGDDAEVFFPVGVRFVAAGSLAGVGVDKVVGLVNGEEADEEVFSVDRVVSVDEYVVL